MLFLRRVPRARGLTLGFNLDSASRLTLCRTGFEPPVDAAAFFALFNHLYLQIIPKRFWNLNAAVGLLVRFDDRHEQAR
jgi:hypothetical protein